MEFHLGRIESDIKFKFRASDCNQKRNIFGLKILCVVKIFQILFGDKRKIDS